MDKPPIDLEKLKEIRDKKNNVEVETDDDIDDDEIIASGAWGWILTKQGWVKRKPDPSLTDPYYNRRHLINVRDFDEWG
jgi:hypothetical protein